MIQPALKEEVHEVLPLLLAAIGDISNTLAGTDDETEVRRILADFYMQEGNRISYRNVLVDKRDDCIAGMLISYGGDDAEMLDRPFVTRIGRENGLKKGDVIALEAKAGEFYLDSIAVDERYQGQGIAKALMSAFEQRGGEQGYSKVSLIVEPDNTRAYSLYQKQNYTEDGFIVVSGTSYIRMVKIVKHEVI